jgi:putative peptide zinc metalloprotease protein
VDEVWRELAQRCPQDTPGQDEVVRLLSQLHLSNLLQFRGGAHHEAIYERGRRHRQREAIGKAMSFLYVRLPLFNPDRLLDRLQPLVRLLTGAGAWLVWAAVVLAGLLTALEHREALSQHGQGLLALSNLPWLYASLTLVKVLHELNHAFVCKRYGGHVPTLGVMFLILTPLPYLDASASWSMRSKWQRAHVGAAGILAEFFLAALGALVWAHTGEGLLNSVAFNVMVVGSVSSVLFNGNPLVRFDAYYVLIDLVEMPNLYQKGQQQWLYYGSRWVLGQKTATEPATDRTERSWFTVYGALTFFYRFSVSASIVMYVLDQWFAVGLVMAVTTALAMVVMPLRKLLAHLSGPALQRGRARAVGAVAALALVAYVGVAVVPLPQRVRLPGVVQAHHSMVLYTETPGRLVELAARHGQVLHAGELIARLSNPDLELSITTTRLQVAEHEALARQALLRAPADVGPLERRVADLRQRLSELEGMAQRLEFRAAQEGEWVAPALHERVGAWIERGQSLGEIVDRSRLRFSAVLSQPEAAELFSLHDPHAELRLMTQPGEVLDMGRVALVPYQRERLVSPALGFFGGGNVPVRSDDASGTTTTEPFFEMHAEFADQRQASAAAYQGLSGVLRLELPARPLLTRAVAALRQLLQTRYDL